MAKKLSIVLSIFRQKKVKHSRITSENRVCMLIKKIHVFNVLWLKTKGTVKSVFIRVHIFERYLVPGKHMEEPLESFDLPFEYLNRTMGF